MERMSQGSRGVGEGVCAVDMKDSMEKGKRQTK